MDPAGIGRALCGPKPSQGNFCRGDMCTFCGFCVDSVASVAFATFVASVTSLATVAFDPSKVSKSRNDYIDEYVDIDCGIIDVGMYRCRG